MAIVKTVDEDQGRAEQLELLEVPAPISFEEALSKRRAEALLHDLDLIEDTVFAAAIGVEPQTLAVWRSEGHGPAYYKLGRKVFYRREALRPWIDSSAVTPGNRAA